MFLRNARANDIEIDARSMTLEIQIGYFGFVFEHQKEKLRRWKSELKRLTVEDTDASKKRCAELRTKIRDAEMRMVNAAPRLQKFFDFTKAHGNI